MWYAWYMDGFLTHCEKENDYKDEIEFETKKDILWEASCNHCDGRKRLTVKRMAQGWYEYSPYNCDGIWGETLTIVNEEAINKYESLRNTFNEFLEQVNKNMEDGEC